MKKITSLMCAVALALPMMAAAPAISAPVKLSILLVEHNSTTPVIDVQYRRNKNHYRPSRNHYRPSRNHHRPRHYNRHNRRGDVAAGIIGGLAAGAIIGGIANSQSHAAPPRNFHVEWCRDRYRSYDARSDTFQPYNGPRQHCNSPHR